ncbi:MAG TPA: TonB-dependent receptor [Rhodanobacteraceae bacterium]
MTYRKTMLSASIVAALMFTGAAFAATNQPVQPQDAASQDSSSQQTAAQKKAQKLDTVTVVGIRDSAALSLQLQKAAVSDINVVTAEDIGKLPAKNVADTLQAVPGIQLQTGSAGEGGFDENDRVSLRGTPPSMTLTQINGHTLASSDWFILNQTATVGRSINYGLLPSEAVAEVVVHKSSEAKLTEGGATGTVDVITRRPLQFKKPITFHASVGAVYSDLPKKSDPQFSALFNYKNDAGTFGILAQAFYEKRQLQRDGQEILGMSQITAATPFAAGHPDLVGAYLPSLLDSALFTQKRVRKGGMVNIEFRPTDDLTIDFEAFKSKMKADNLNRSLSFWGVQALNANSTISDYAIKHNLLTNATFTSTDPSGQSLLGVYDQIGRPGASASTGYVTGDVNWNVTDNFSLHAQAGTTEGHGRSPVQNVLETNIYATGASYEMRGLGQGANWTLGDNQFSQPTNGSHNTAFGWIFGDGGIDVKSESKWLALDGTLDFFNAGPLESLDFGTRYEKNTKGNGMDFGQGPLGGTDYATAWESLPVNSTYPSNFNSTLGISGPQSIWYLSQSQLAQYNAGHVNRTLGSNGVYSTDPADGGISRFNPGNVYWVHEKDTAVYLQANFAGNNWSGNVGVRYVHTNQNVQYTATTQAETKTQGPYYSAFYPNGYFLNFHQYNYNKVLPSVNLKYHISPNVVARTAWSQTLTRADYSALSGALSLSDPILTGTGGNPNLKPLISTNFDTGLAWYFAPRGLLSIDVFNQQLHNYVDFKDVDETFKNQTASGTGPNVFDVYKVSIPDNIDGHVRGVELDWQQPIGEHFGTLANYTFTTGEADGGRPLQGLSKTTFNVGGYFENAKWHARINYTYRSSYYAGPDRGGDFYMEGTGYLSAQIGYDVTKWLSLNLVGRNLNNPTLKYYVQSDSFGKAPRSFYVNGRQYYLTANFKF